MHSDAFQRRIILSHIGKPIPQAAHGTHVRGVLTVILYAKCGHKP